MHDDEYIVCYLTERRYRAPRERAVRRTNGYAVVRVRPVSSRRQGLHDPLLRLAARRLNPSVDATRMPGGHFRQRALRRSFDAERRCVLDAIDPTPSHACELPSRGDVRQRFDIPVSSLAG